VVATVEQGLSGAVRVGILSAMALPELPGVLSGFYEKYPDVRIVLQNEPRGSRELVQAILDDRLDVAFTSIPPDRYPGELTVTPLKSEELELALPPGHSLAGSRGAALAELDRETFVDYPPGWGIRQATDAIFASNGLARRIALEVADIPTVFGLVRSGRAAAFVIPSTIPDGPGLELIPVHPAPCLDVALTLRAAVPVRRATVAFVEAVRARFATNGETGSVMDPVGDGRAISPSTGRDRRPAVRFSTGHAQARPCNQNRSRRHLAVGPIRVPRGP
jgi:DNA-binding transcriptional LysR family regulator